jgi:hypothetical protein
MWRSVALGKKMKALIMKKKILFCLVALLIVGCAQSPYKTAEIDKRYHIARHLGPIAFSIKIPPPDNNKKTGFLFKPWDIKQGTINLINVSNYGFVMGDVRLFIDSVFPYSISSPANTSKKGYEQWLRQVRAGHAQEMDEREIQNSPFAHRQRRKPNDTVEFKSIKLMGMDCIQLVEHITYSLDANHVWISSDQDYINSLINCRVVVEGKLKVFGVYYTIKAYPKKFEKLYGKSLPSSKELQNDIETHLRAILDTLIFEGHVSQYPALLRQP